jgi:hypothetical protein
MGAKWPFRSETPKADKLKYLGARASMQARMRDQERMGLKRALPVGVRVGVRAATAEDQKHVGLRLSYGRREKRVSRIWVTR